MRLWHVGKHHKRFTISQTTGAYAAGLAICGAAMLFLISQVDNPLLQINKPPAQIQAAPPVGTVPANPQVTASRAPSDLVPRAHVRGGLTPTPTASVPQQRSEGVPQSPLPTPADLPTTTPPPVPQRPSQTTTAPRPPAPPRTTVPPVVVNPPILPPVKVPLTPLCNGLNVLPQVSTACNDILGNVVGALTGVTAVGGRGARPSNPTSCHPKGLALDLIVRNRLMGDLIVAYVRLNKTRLGITTILWRVPDHYDHVHLSFAPCTK